MSIKGAVGYLKEKAGVYITNGIRADLLAVLLLSVFMLGSSCVIAIITAIALVLCLYKIYKYKSVLPFSSIIYLIPAAHIANIWLQSAVQLQYVNALVWVVLSVLYILYKTVFKRVSVRSVLVHNIPDSASSDYKPERSDLVTILVLPLSLVGLMATIWSPIVALYVGVALVAILAAASAYLLVNRTRSLHEDESAIRVIEQYKPAFAIFFSLGKPSQNNYAMWDEYFKKVDKPFIVITPQRKHFDPLAKITTAPVVYCRSQHLQERLIVSSRLKAIFYPNNSGNNLGAMTPSSVHHVHIGHGDSDKATSYRAITAMYDKIFVAGQAAIDRYEDNGVFIPKDKFMIVGRPQVEGIKSSRNEIESVLYAPTWHGDAEAFDYSSLYLGREVVQSLISKGLRVIFRPHPASRLSSDLSRTIDDVYGMLAKDELASGIKHLYGQAAESDIDIIDCMNESDLMISDVSSVTSDYLYSSKPMILIAMKESPESFVKTYPTARAAYTVDSSLCGIDDIITDLVSGRDSMARHRKRMKTHYLSKVVGSGDYSDLFTSAVKKVLETPNMRNRSS